MEGRPLRVLLVDDDLEVLETTRAHLEAAGFICRQARHGEEGLRLIESDPPDVVVSDIAMPVMDGLTLCRKVKTNIFLCRVPVMLLTARAQVDDRISGFESGADDYLIKPIDLRELAARIKALVRRYRMIMDLNPSTKLPGANAAEDEILRRIREARKFALCYADIDNFKAYADTYGFEHANRAIKLTARILGDALRGLKEKDTFLAHIGGDDFIILTRPAAAMRVSKRVIKAFDQRIRTCFSERDLRNEYFLGFDRDGNFRKFPIMAISIAILSTETHEFRSARAIGEMASRLKREAKRVPGSHIARFTPEGPPRG